MAAEGGCQCGAVRYRVAGQPVAATLCHCADCRRASGGTNIAWAVFDKSNFEWVEGEPADYESSPGIHWLFCRECGSTVGYRRAERPDHMDITTGTLDQPDLLPPNVEIWVKEKIGWAPLHPDLPKRQRSSLNEPAEADRPGDGSTRPADIPLFSYGTLQLREVQLANYGRELEGTPDALVGHRLITLPDRDPDAVRISGTNTHMVVRRTGDPADRVDGIVFLLTADELAVTDRYEGSDYGRAELLLESGRRALVYVEPQEH